MAGADINLLLFNSQQARWFLPLGHSDDKITEINYYIGAGLVWYGLFSRPDDIMGFDMTHVTTSDYLKADLQSSETAVEIFHRFQLTDNLSLNIFLTQQQMFLQMMHGL